MCSQATILVLGFDFLAQTPLNAGVKPLNKFSNLWISELKAAAFASGVNLDSAKLTAKNITDR
jgi:hypothetical protein